MGINANLHAVFLGWSKTSLKLISGMPALLRLSSSGLRTAKPFVFEQMAEGLEGAILTNLVDLPLVAPMLGYGPFLVSCDPARLPR
jgi:hypothetical protein